MAHSGGPSQQQLPDAALRLLCQQRPAQRHPGQQQLPDAALLFSASSVLLSNISAATAPPAGQQLCLGAPASNKPHSAERSTPVWLAIWRTWAGFANSQLWRATIRCTY